MLVGQQFGPFAIDKELGSGAMGTVYRGRFTKSGQIMAVKVMAPGIGSTNAAAFDRFEREIAILKQLNHPNIVRFYGSGKQQSLRYFAMEFVDGESLDKVMGRRGRMTWEEVVELGKQLCSALQHAHERGIVHRDLKPSNIMVLPDGTLKLTDFGIAKDIDVEGLTATNCTVGTAAYMSPEQCKGERDLSHKSDLYSLGIMFYELVTGRKPFKADNAMEIFMAHVTGTFERPSRLVLDIPVWLDTLICQLMEKKPDQRPLDASMVATTLNSIREKVETQQSAGVETVRRRLVDRSPGQKRLDEEDKDAARLLMTGKGRSKRKRGKKPFYEKAWIKAIGLALALGIVATLLFLVFRKPSAEKLYQQAKAVMQSEDAEKQENAIEASGVITKYLHSYGEPENEQNREVRGWRMQIQAARWERLLDKHMQQVRDNSTFKVKPADKTQEDAFAAVEAEEKGDRKTAIERWQSVKKQEGADSPWARVAEKHVGEWNALGLIDALFLQWYERIRNSGEEPQQTDDRQREAFLAWRMENSAVGDAALASMMFKSLRDEVSKAPGSRPQWYLYAAWHKYELDRELEKAEGEKEPKSTIRKRPPNLDSLRQKLAGGKIRKADKRLLCLDVVALYDQNKEMAKVVEEAKKILQDLTKG